MPLLLYARSVQGVLVFLYLVAKGWSSDLRFRFWTIGGEHTRKAKFTVCEEEYNGDWTDLKKSAHKALYKTCAEICVGLSPREALEVRRSPFPNFVCRRSMQALTLALPLFDTSFYVRFFLPSNRSGCFTTRESRSARTTTPP